MTMQHKRVKQILLLALPLLFKYIFFLVFVDLDVFDIIDVKEDLLFFAIVALLIYTPLFQNKIGRGSS